MAAPAHLRLGRWAEDQARDYLQARGLRLLERNFGCRLGEIDLIMRDGAVMVFVEVRYRGPTRYGAGFETVTRVKQRKLLAAAGVFVGRLAAPPPACRFDVVSVTKRNYGPDFHWIKDAFGQDG